MIEIIHADFIEAGPLECASTITDPPYSPYVHGNMASMGSNGAGPVDRDPGFDALTPELRAAILAQCAVSSRWSVVFSDLEGVGTRTDDGSMSGGWAGGFDGYGVEYVRTIPWIRWSQPQLSGTIPPTGAEAIIIGHSMHVGPRGGTKPKAKRWNGPGELTFFDARCMRGKEKHPTEKPLDLMLDLVCYFSDPGELVVDPCGGAGTTAEACRILGRDCVVFERKAEFARTAAARVKSPLSLRSRDRLERWVERVSAELADASDEHAVERTARRTADLERGAAWL